MNKLVLIIPPSPWLISDRDIPMMGVLYLSSYLKSKGFNVDVCDLSSLEENNWFIPVGTIYGITGVSPQFIYIKKIIEKIKSREPNSLVIVGGVHATCLPYHILDNTKADMCILGEGEIPLEQILQGYNFEFIKGIVTREFNNGFSSIVDLNATPFPDRCTIDYYSYLVPRTFGYMANVKREGSIITGRGCPYNCSFCSSKTMHYGKVRLLTPQNVVIEMLYLERFFGVEMINILDDTFIVDKKRVSLICKGLKENRSNLKWFCLTRVDCIDEDLLYEMKDAGCLSLAIGFETGSNRLLKLMNKRATVEQATACIKMVNKVGLLINGQLMVGLPTENEEDVELTVKFIKENPEVDTFGLHIFQPFPGCDIWTNPVKYDITINKNTDFSDFHTIGKPDAKIRKEVADRFFYIKDVLGNRSREKRLYEGK